MPSASMPAANKDAPSDLADSDVVVDPAHSISPNLGTKDEEHPLFVESEFPFCFALCLLLLPVFFCLLLLFLLFLSLESATATPLASVEYHSLWSDQAPTALQVPSPVIVLV